MKITHKGRFISGVVDIILGITLIVIVLFNHLEAHKLVISAMCLFAGVMTITNSVETKAQRLKRKEELEMSAELYGWNKKEEEE